MTDNKKDRASAATLERSDQRIDTGTGATSGLHITTAQGHGQGITASQIQKEYGYSPRDVRRLVNFERVAHGQLICSGRRGYYFGDDQEVQDTINRLRRMGTSDFEVADAMERALRQRQGQEIMDGW